MAVSAVKSSIHSCNVSLCQLVSSTNKHVDTLHNVILFRVIWVILARNFKYSRNCLIVVFQYMSHIVSNVLVDKNNSDVISFDEGMESLINCILFGIRFYNEEICFISRTVSDTSQEKPRDSVL